METLKVRLPLISEYILGLLLIALLALAFTSMRGGGPNPVSGGKINGRPPAGGRITVSGGKLNERPPAGGSITVSGGKINGRPAARSSVPTGSLLASTR